MRTYDTKYGNLAVGGLIAALVHAGHHDHCVAGIELRVLRVLPIECLHVVRVLDAGRERGVPHLYEFYSRLV